MRSIYLALASGLVLAGTSAAQTTASFNRYGLACTHTLGTNMGLKAPALKTQVLANEYCYGFKAPAGATVLGFSVYTKTASSTSKPITMDCGFYRKSSGGSVPNSVRATKGPCTVDTGANWYTCVFATPQVVKKDELFWLSQFNSNTIRASSTTNGAKPAIGTYWRRPPGGTNAWSLTGIITGPVVAVILKDEAPILSSVGVPKLGNATFAIKITNAGGPANLVRMVLGISDKKTLGGLTLPFDLGVLGFKGCKLYASDEFYLGPAVTNAAGEATFPLPVPNTGSLSGLNFYVQSFVVTRSSAVTFTNAGKALIK
jgi:hypothetical protein